MDYLGESINDELMDNSCSQAQRYYIPIFLFRHTSTKGAFSFCAWEFSLQR